MVLAWRFSATAILPPLKAAFIYSNGHAALLACSVAPVFHRQHISSIP